MFTIFCQLLQVSVGARDCLSRSLDEDEWQVLFEIASKQALAGILFEGLRKLPQEQWPKRSIVLRWTMAAEDIRRRNVRTTEVCIRLRESLIKDGFNVCILKGQANHTYYDLLPSSDSLGMMRTCGDIDAWIWPKAKTRNPVKDTINYCRNRKILLSLCYLHAEVKPMHGVPIEIHFRPSFLNAPWRDYHLHRLFEHAQFSNSVIDGCCELTKLRPDYDLIFQMNHIYRHLLDEGVGMRQVVDFYVLLLAYHQERKNNCALMVISELMMIVKGCGMGKFASALMFVLISMFDIDKNLLLCTPSKKHGTFLLDEMMKAGNFGHHDDRMESIVVEKGKLSFQLKKAKRRFKRNLRFLSSYPEEVICEPIARVYHTIWRKYKLYRF